MIALELQAAIQKLRPWAAFGIAIVEIASPDGEIDTDQMWEIGEKLGLCGEEIADPVKHADTKGIDECVPGEDTLWVFEQPPECVADANT